MGYAKMTAKDDAGRARGFQPRLKRSRKYADTIKSEADYSQTVRRLADELLKEHNPERVGEIASMHIIYVDELQRSNEELEAINRDLFSAITRLQEMLMQSIEECANRLTIDDAAKFASMAVKAFDTYRGKKSVSMRPDQMLKPGWVEHCKAAVESGKKIETLGDLLDLRGYDPRVMLIQQVTLRKWARSAGVQFKPGRPKA